MTTVSVNGFEMIFRAGLYVVFFLTGILWGGRGVVSLSHAQIPPSDLKERVDAVLVLDGSGSMRVTDPGRLRDEGAKLLLEFLKPGDRVAIVEFSGDAKVVRPLGPFERDTIGAVSADVERVGNSGQFTDILAGLKLARSILDAEARADANQVIVLLSDGKLDPDPAVVSPGASKATLTEFLPTLREDGIKVHTLAFGDQVDKALLAEIAAATEGLSWFTPTASKIHESYAQLFLVVKNPQVLPLTSKGFKIDAGIDEATFYINREAAESAISLVAPDGVKITAATAPKSVRWFEGQKFDVVTVLQPRPGDWRISGLPSGDSFATVLTNLKLITDWPVAANLGSPLLVQARLFENEKPVVLREMAGATKYAFEITPSDKVSEPIIREFLVDDGTRGDKVAHDGIFSHQVEFEDVGEYKLKVVARAPTFERSQQLAFRIKPRMVELSVEGAHGDGSEAAGESHSGGVAGDGREHGDTPKTLGESFVVRLSTEAQALRRVDVKLVAVGPDKKRYKIPLEKSDDGYRGQVFVLPEDGEYELRALLSGEMRKAGKMREGGGATVTVRAESALLRYHRHHQAGEEALVKLVLVDQEKETSAGVNYLAVLIVNVILGGVLFTLLKNAGTGSKEPLPVFVSLDESKSLLETLRSRVDLVEVDAADPLFAGEEELPLFSVGAASLLAEKVSIEKTAPADGAETPAAAPASEKSADESAPQGET